MNEIYEFRVNDEHAHLLFEENEGKNIEGLVKIIRIKRTDPRFKQIEELSIKLRNEFNSAFFFGWNILYKYSKQEIENAQLFYFYSSTIFEPAGEECGTIYDESSACKICGSGAKRVGPLILKSSAIPKKDISCTIAGEYVVSEKLVNTSLKYKLKGISFNQIHFEKIKGKKVYEMVFESHLHLSNKTHVGVHPFNFSESEDAGESFIKGANYLMKNVKEIYKCPKGHLIGLNLLSEPYIKSSPKIKEFDLFETYERIGVRRGLLRPETLFICSPSFREMVIAEKLSGFRFIIANIVL